MGSGPGKNYAWCYYLYQPNLQLLLLLFMHIMQTFFMILEYKLPLALYEA
jgi:hypothetical protein